MDRLLALIVLISSAHAGIDFIPSPPEASPVSRACSEDLRKLNEGLQNLTTWAVEMWDASAKVEVGLFEGDTYQMGNFDECLDPIHGRKGVKRQYCLAVVQLQQEGYVASNENPMKYRSDAREYVLLPNDPFRLKRHELFWAMCLPASCSEEDLNIVLNDYPYFSTLSARYNMTYTVSLDKNLCQTDNSEVPFSPGSVIFICLSTLLCILALISTFYHWLAEYKINDAEKKSSIVCPQWAKSFSVLYNLSQLKIKGEESLRIVYGLRVFSILFIIYGHLYGCIMAGPIKNRADIERSFDESYLLKIWTQQLETYVDTFFVLSGFFSVYFLLKYAGNVKNRFSFAHILGGRYVRLMPLYGFVIFFTSTILPQMGSGPFWTLLETEAKYCTKNWWTNMLLINNYVNVDELCMNHSWFVPTDFHYYILTSVLIFFVMRKPEKQKLALIIIGVALALSIIFPFMITYIKEYDPVMYFDYEFVKAPKTHEEFQNMYILSHTRASPYIIGMFTGFIYYKYYKNVEPIISMNKSTMGVIGALIGYTFISMIPVYFFDGRLANDPFDSAIHAALYRVAKAIFTSIIILMCIFGNVPLVTSFLGWSGFIPLGKLSYAVYLVHMMLIFRFAASMRQPFVYEFSSSSGAIVAYPVLSFIFGLIGYLLIEAPITNLFKYIITPKKRKPKENDAENGHVNNGIEISERT